jgi:hypothetical protein
VILKYLAIHALLTVSVSIGEEFMCLAYVQVSCLCSGVTYGKLYVLKMNSYSLHFFEAICQNKFSENAFMTEQKV